MKRITLTDGAGWFNDESARHFEECVHFDGSNMVSNATGSQWEHQELILTGGGTWVLLAWSQWQGTTREYTRIGTERAAAWLIAQGYGDDLPDSLDGIAASTEI